MTSERMETKTLDKLYLEWSQFTSVRTKRELEAAHALERLMADWPDKEAEMKAWDYGAEVLKSLRSRTSPW